MPVVYVVDAESTVRSDAHLPLQGPFGAVEPFASTETGSSFVSLPGEHVLRVKAPSCADAQKKIVLKPCAPRAGKPQIVIVHLERR